MRRVGRAVDRADGQRTHWLVRVHRGSGSFVSAQANFRWVDGVCVYRGWRGATRERYMLEIMTRKIGGWGMRVGMMVVVLNMMREIRSCGTRVRCERRGPCGQGSMERLQGWYSAQGWGSMTRRILAVVTFYRRGDVDVRIVVDHVDEFLRERCQSCNRLANDIPQLLDYTNELVVSSSLSNELFSHPLVFFPHTTELSGDLPRQLNPLLHPRIRLQRLPLDLIEQIRSSPQELAVRELPGLRVGGGALGAGGPVNLMKPIHIELPDEGGEIIMLEVTSQYTPTELAHIRNDERSAQFRPSDEVRRLRIVDHLEKLRHKVIRRRHR